MGYSEMGEYADVQLEPCLPRRWLREDVDAGTAGRMLRVPRPGPPNCCVAARIPLIGLLKMPVRMATAHLQSQLARNFPAFGFLASQIYCDLPSSASLRPYRCSAPDRHAL